MLASYTKINDIIRAMKKGEPTLIELADYSLHLALYRSRGLCRPYLPLPGYLLKRLQKIEFAAASFIYGRYVNDIGGIVKLNWLPVEERRDFNLLKLTFKALITLSSGLHI